MKKTLLSISILVAVAVWAGGGFGHQAQAQQPSDQVTVLIFDRDSLNGSLVDTDLINSFLGLIFKLKEGQPFTFVAIDDPLGAIGPVETDSMEFSDFRRELDVMLAMSSGAERDLAAALAEIYNFLGGEFAGAQSSIYFITGSNEDLPTPVLQSGLDQMVSLLDQKGWPVHSVTLPGTAEAVVDTLSDISRNTGGESYSLSIPDGLQNFTDRTLRMGAKGSLTELGSIELTPNTSLEMTMHIAPGTETANLIFFREDQVTAFRIRNPEGYEASAGDRTSSSITELPNVVMWEIIDPAPGKWQIDARGVDGVISGWHYATNKYSLMLQSFGAQPLGQPATLAAYVFEHGQPVVIEEEVELIARIISPDGTSVTYSLNDDGVFGDAVAGDAYFAATIPPQTTEGDYMVHLELSWSKLEHAITARDSFEIRAFPSLKVTPVEMNDLRSGERTKIATIFANINGNPIALLGEQISVDMATAVENHGEIEVVPGQIITEGKASNFDVFYTPAEETLSTIIVRLSMEYEGRLHSFATDSMVVSTLRTVGTVAPTPEPPPPPVVLPTPVPPQLPVFVPVEEPGIPVALVVVLAVVSVSILGAAAYWLTRSTPFGYLYGDRGQLVVDFSTLERRPVTNLVQRNVVNGTELGISGLEGAKFTFVSPNQVIMSSGPSSHATIRVNNQPLIGQMSIHDNTWVGAAGRLYSFSMTPPEGSTETEPAPATAD